jgi:hypothetical protein
VNRIANRIIVITALASLGAQTFAEEAKNPPIDPSKAVDMGIAMPTPLDKFLALTILVKTRKIDWGGVFNAVAVDINPDDFTDTEVLIPQILGVRIADGVMAVQAKDAEMLGKTASDIEKLAKKLNVSDNELERARRVRTLANEGKWLDVYRELAFLQQDILQKLDENPTDQRSALLMIAGWIQGSRYSSQLITAHYSDESSNILREPLLVKALISKSSTLPAAIQKLPSVAMISDTLPTLLEIVSVKIDEPIPKDQVAKVDQLATKCIEQILKGN